jgi:hypothetical protein
MALGDGIRRDVAKISQAERDLLVDAFLKLDTTKIYPDGVSHWDKQEDIHKNAHFAGVDVHSGPAFIPWHRVIVNRLEALIREVHPELSLHYWDWTTDPRSTANGRANLFTPQFMGSDNGNAGPPFQDFESTEKTDPLGDGIHDKIWRQVANGVPNVDSDNTILAPPDFAGFNSLLQSSHNNAHGYIGGSLGDAHFSFHDPFVFLLHSNMDRLWAMWQVADPSRFEPGTAYSGLSNQDSQNLDGLVEPWAGDTGLEPWSSDVTIQAKITYRDPSVLAPPCYDTLPTHVVVNQIETPGSIINFNDVPQGETQARAAVFKVFACDDVTLEIKPGSGPNAPYSVLTPGGSVTLHHPPQSYVEIRIWFGFTGGVPNAPAPDGNVIIHCPQNGKDYPFTLKGNSINRPKVAVMLALDQSGSMDDPAGTTGARRIEVLRDAASKFVDLIQPNNGVGLIRFDTDAYPVNDPTYPGLDVTAITSDSMIDPNRVVARQKVQSHQTNPNGSTSIGDGVALAQTTLGPVSGYDQKAIIVFTDGLENEPQSIDDVMGSIDQQTFAIGLGNESQVSTAALYKLANKTGGYLLLTGLLSASPDDYFRLSKYFWQILAGVTNTSIVLDPSGFIAPGQKLRIPFVLTEADIDSTVALFTDLPVVGLTVETPHGNQDITLSNAGGLGVNYSVNANLRYCRFNLPVALGGGEHAGTWHARLEVDASAFKRLLAKLGDDSSAQARARAHGARFSLNITSFSNLRVQARLGQSSLEPGAIFNLRASLTEYGIPVQRRASVKAELRRPDNTTAILTLNEVEPGVFETTTSAPLPGLYFFRVLASGFTLRNMPFTRERFFTGATLVGGDGPLPFGGSDPDGSRTRLCRLIACLLNDKSIQRCLKGKKVDPRGLLHCLKMYCETSHHNELHSASAKSDWRPPSKQRSV